MTNPTAPRFLLIETSGRQGRVALASGGVLLRAKALDETRRHARDLAPAAAELLAAEGWRPRDVQAVIVSRGPGSYTGLRVGVMAAKVFAYATGAVLIAVETFQAVAAQAGQEVTAVEAIADAQQDKIYVQRFARAAPGAIMTPATVLAIRPFAEWLANRDAAAWVSGPGLRRFGARLPAGSRVVDPADWDPRPESLLRLGGERYRRGLRDDPWTLEPLYLRPSAAEEQWKAVDARPRA